jgi:hypothetical protein
MGREGERGGGRGATFKFFCNVEILGKGDASRISHLVRNNLIGGLCSLLHAPHLERLSVWPSYFNGGVQALAALVTQVLNLRKPKN